MNRWAKAIKPAKALPGAFTLGEIQRFASKLSQGEQQTVNAEVQTPCWLWNGGKDKAGYGFFKWRGRKLWAHRVAFHVFRGGLVDDMQVDHLCFCPSCCNPEHLELKDPETNWNRKARSLDNEPAPF